MITKQIIIRSVAVLITFVGVQLAYADHHIPGDLSIGTWDPINRIYTLTTDVGQAIQIDQDNLTLDGDGYSVIGSGPFDPYPPPPKSAEFIFMEELVLTSRI
jgi:hypothetical protein